MSMTSRSRARRRIIQLDSRISLGGYQVKSLPTFSAIALAVAILCPGAANTQTRPSARIPIDEALAQVRYPLAIDSHGQLTGEGGSKLKEAMAGARYIAVGEDHITHEIPKFVSALCDALAPDLGALALEVGPRTLKIIDPILRSKDRAQGMHRFVGKYPNALAFLDTSDDNAATAHCQSAAHRRDFRLIGADQEFVNSTGALLDRALATPLNGKAKEALTALRQRDREAVAKALATGDPSSLLLFASKDEDWARAAEALHEGGNPEARGIIDD